MDGDLKALAARMAKFKSKCKNKAYRLFTFHKKRFC